MKTNTYFIQLAVIILVIFGGTFLIRFFRTGDFLLDQYLAASFGITLLFTTLIWNQINK